MPGHLSSLSSFAKRIDSYRLLFINIFYVEIKSTRQHNNGFRLLIAIEKYFNHNAAIFFISRKNADCGLRISQNVYRVLLPQRKRPIGLNFYPDAGIVENYTGKPGHKGEREDRISDLIHANSPTDSVDKVRVPIRLEAETSRPTIDVPAHISVHIRSKFVRYFARTVQENGGYRGERHLLDDYPKDAARIEEHGQ